MRDASSNGRGRLSLALVTVFLLAFGGLLAILATGSPELLELLDKLGSAGGLVIGATTLLVSVAAFHGVVPRRARSGAIGATALDQAAAVLGEQVRRQWTREMTVRLLDRPQPLLVRWSSTGRAVAARAEDVLAGAVAGRVTRLHIEGDVTAVAEAFRRLPARQMVVIGQPGAGKTVLAMLLTTALLQKGVDGPVPVLLAVSSWNPVEPVDAWLARRIVEDYPFLADTAIYGPAAAARLVSSQRVLPVLDGLDEMPPAWQAKAIRALNNVIGGSRPLVLTCRSDEYETAIAAAGTPLARAAVVELEPVATSDAARFLPAGQLDSQARWAPVIADLTAHPDGPLAAAMSTPLMVYLARTVYSGARTEPGELCDRARFPDRTTLESHLLEGYLPAVFDTDSVTGSRYSIDRTCRWLMYLAHHLDRLDTHDFAWWQLPSAVRHRRLWFGLVFWVATVSVFAVLGALAGVTADAVDGYTASWPNGIIAGAIRIIADLTSFAPVVGLVAGLAAVRAEATIPARPGPAGLLARIGRAAAGGLIYGSALGASEALVFGDTHWTMGLRGAVFGLLLSLVPDERGSAGGRRRDIARGMGQGVGLGLLLGAVDAASWAFDLGSGGLGVGCGVVAGIAVVRVADAVPRDRGWTLRTGVIRGLVGAVAVAPFGALVMVAYGIAVGVGIVVSRTNAAASRVHRRRAAARQAFVAGLLFGPVSMFDSLSEVATIVAALMCFAVLWLVAVGRDAAPNPTSRSRRTRLLVEGGSVGVVTGCLLAITPVIFGDPFVASIVFGAIAGLFVGLVALAAGLATSAGELDLVDPRSALRSDRRATLATVVVAAIVFSSLGAFDGDFTLGGVYGALILLTLTFRSRWPEFAAARLLLTLQRRLPVRLMRFLDDAHRRGVLRQVGAVYQLRHARLRTHLTAR